MYSAYNDVTYLRRLGEFDKGRSICLQKNIEETIFHQEQT